MDEDKALLQRIAANDRKAFEQFMQRHLHNVVMFANRILNDVSQAEDVAQEAFVRVWKNASKWSEQGSKVSSWLYRIVYNLCIDIIRKRKETQSELEELESAQDISADYEKANQLELIKKGIFSLPERQKTALMLNVYHDQGAAEIAAIMDISVQAVESLLARARRSLMQRLNFMRETL